MYEGVSTYQEVAVKLLKVASEGHDGQLAGDAHRGVIQHAQRVAARARTGVRDASADVDWEVIDEYATNDGVNVHQEVGEWVEESADSIDEVVNYDGIVKEEVATNDEAKLPRH